MRIMAKGTSAEAPNATTACTAVSAALPTTAAVTTFSAATLGTTTIAAP